jgi:hypothetical protein
MFTSQEARVESCSCDIWVNFLSIEPIGPTYVGVDHSNITTTKFRP